MAYTSTDLENLERAAVNLALGTRKAAITLSDGMKVEFTPATLPQLRDFIAKEVRPTVTAAATSRRGYSLGSTSKGF